MEHLHPPVSLQARECSRNITPSHEAAAMSSTKCNARVTASAHVPNHTTIEDASTEPTKTTVALNPPRGAPDAMLHLRGAGGGPQCNSVLIAPFGPLTPTQPISRLVVTMAAPLQPAAKYVLNSQASKSTMADPPPTAVQQPPLQLPYWFVTAYPS